MKLLVKISMSKITQAIFMLANSIWAIPLLLIIRAIRPFFIIKFGTFNSGRIGHFASDVGQKYAELKIKKVSRMVTLYWLPSYISNNFWGDMVRRNFYVSGWVKPLDFWNRNLPFGGMHIENSTNTASRDIHGFQQSLGYSMPFLDSELEVAKEWLKNLGWKEGEPFVCLLVRDSEYLKKLYGSSKDLTYHDYRDSDIANYISAAEWLAAQGVWVFRMGQEMKVPMQSSQSRVIDYAFHQDKNEFMDVWLFAHCDLCISTGSGPDMIADAYRRPSLFLNYIPIGRLISWSDSIHAPKILQWRVSGELLSLDEYLEHSYMETEEYFNKGINIIDLNSDQILSYVKEAWSRHLDQYRDMDEWNSINAKFWEIAKADKNYKYFHSYIHPRAGLSLEWIRDQKTINPPVFISN